MRAREREDRLLNAMIELVVVWRKVVFAAALRATDLSPSAGRTARTRCATPPSGRGLPLADLRRWSS
jgi:hypothetical protein